MKKLLVTYVTATALIIIGLAVVAVFTSKSDVHGERPLIIRGKHSNKSSSKYSGRTAHAAKLSETGVGGNTQ